MADIDPKDIGLAIKDIVLGVGTVAAGVTGGPAAAGGVKQAGSALDRILGMAGVASTRAEQFDRADFTARPRSPLSRSKPEAEPGRSAPSQPTPAPRGGDARIALDHLRTLGWSDEAAQQIVSGPERGSPHGAHAAERTEPQDSVQPEDHERWKRTLDLYSQQSKQRSKANGGLG